MSANRRLTGISAPRTPSLFRPLMHEPQMSGLPGKRANPTWRRRRPPDPRRARRRACSWVRGGCVASLDASGREPGSSPERKPRIASSGSRAWHRGGQSYSCPRPISNAWRSGGPAGRGPQPGQWLDSTCAFAPAGAAAGIRIAWLSTKEGSPGGGRNVPTRLPPSSVHFRTHGATGSFGRSPAGGGGRLSRVPRSDRRPGISGWGKVAVTVGEGHGCRVADPIRGQVVVRRRSTSPLSMTISSLGRAATSS